MIERIHGLIYCNVWCRYLFDAVLSGNVVLWLQLLYGFIMSTNRWVKRKPSQQGWHKHITDSKYLPRTNTTIDSSFCLFPKLHWEIWTNLKKKELQNCQGASGNLLAGLFEFQQREAGCGDVLGGSVHFSPRRSLQDPLTWTDMSMKFQ